MIRRRIFLFGLTLAVFLYFFCWLDSLHAVFAVDRCESSLVQGYLVMQGISPLLGLTKKL